MSTSVQQRDFFARAAQLLIAIAGPEPVHIEMSAHGPKKYYDVHRRFEERDARAHLQGDRTKGATLRYPDGRTRALCYDADTSEDWQCLQEAARILANFGYLPLLEASPIGRGGHVWIIFTDLVCAEIAQQCLLSMAPDLQAIPEYWPRSTYKIRLPAGTYIKPGFVSWCTLTDAQGSILSTNGPAAAPILLTYQTPVALIREANRKQNLGKPGADFARTMHRVNTQRQVRDRVSIGQVDTCWQQRYNSRTLWFQFTPQQLAALYNERHPLSEMLTLEQSGMAFSPNVPERTPSTAITPDGQAWVDFSARSLQPNGKHDGGDALELAARRNGESKAAKSNTLREAARMLVRDARTALEGAARAGEEPPAWVAQIMTNAGWQRYHSLKSEAARALAGTSTRGAVGYTSVGMSTHATQEPFTRQGTQHTSYERHPELNSLEALAAEIEAQIGEPCGQCGCTLFYQSGPYRMCQLCYPRPAKLGRLTDEQWQRLRRLFPSKPAHIDHARRRR